MPNLSPEHIKSLQEWVQNTQEQEREPILNKIAEGVFNGVTAGVKDGAKGAFIGATVCGGGVMLASCCNPAALPAAALAATAGAKSVGLGRCLMAGVHEGIGDERIKAFKEYLHTECGWSEANADIAVNCLLKVPAFLVVLTQYPHFLNGQELELVQPHIETVHDHIHSAVGTVTQKLHLPEQVTEAITTIAPHLTVFLIKNCGIYACESVKRRVLGHAGSEHELDLTQQISRPWVDLSTRSRASSVDTVKSAL